MDAFGWPGRVTELSWIYYGKGEIVDRWCFVQLTVIKHKVLESKIKDAIIVITIKESSSAGSIPIYPVRLTISAILVRISIQIKCAHPFLLLTHPHHSIIAWFYSSQ